ncbi:hypothetical protein HCJ46_16310 [Listeria booriae]|uniref:hypothetical protein n=1 Tax=Listeria booriae TaxID=1552123 RepID=UPI00162819A5|nr:hypothetical protein [Listeria booriae]MBC1920323.1 hypothetical protein [Listeria booriae]
MKNEAESLFYIYYKKGKYEELEPGNKDKLIRDFLDNIKNQDANDALIVSLAPRNLEFIFWTKQEADKENLPVQVADFFLSFYEYVVEANWGEVDEDFFLSFANTKWTTEHVMEYRYQ